MTVYILHYQNYEDSEIRGVYTEAAMNKEIIRYAEQGCAIIKKMIAEQEIRIESLKVRRRELGQEDRKLQEKQKQLEADGVHNARKLLKSERKKLLKQMDQLAWEIRNREHDIEQMKSMTYKQLAEREMERNHLYFEEFNIIES